MTENYRQLNYTSDQINEQLGKVDFLSKHFPGLEKKANTTEKEVNSIKGDGYDSEEIKPTLMSLEADLAKLQGNSKEDAGSVTHLWWAHNNLENSVQEIQNTYVTQENLQQTDNNINALSETMEEFYATKQEVNTLEGEGYDNEEIKPTLMSLKESFTNLKGTSENDVGSITYLQHTLNNLNNRVQEIENNYALKSELSGLASIEYVDELIGNINSILATLSDGGNTDGDN